MSHEYPLVRERKVLSFCATNPTQTLRGHSRVSSSTGRGRHCCPKLRVKVQPCRGHSNRQGGRTAVQTPDTGEIGRGCCPALETTHAVSKPISPPLELHPQRSFPKYTTKCLITLAWSKSQETWSLLLQFRKSWGNEFATFHSGNSSFLLF